LTLPIYRGRKQHGKGREAGDKGTGNGRAGYGRQEVLTPLSPPPLMMAQAKRIYILIIKVNKLFFTVLFNLRNRTVQYVAANRLHHQQQKPVDRQTDGQTATYPMGTHSHNSNFFNNRSQGTTPKIGDLHHDFNSIYSNQT